MERARVGKTLTLAASICLVVAAANARSAEVARPQPQTRGYLVTYFTYAMYFDPNFDKNCPKGWFPNLSEAYLASLSPAERARLQKPENVKEFGSRFRQEGTEGAYGEDACSNAKAFKNDPRYPAVLDHYYRGKIAKGFDLHDGPGAPKVCRHQTFTSPEGKPGIDNQFFRAMGCARDWRGGNQEGGEQVDVERRYMEGGTNVYLLEISGITDLKHDNVEVRFYSTDEVPRVGLNRRFIPNQTLRPRAEPRFINVMHGRIVNGVLTTVPIDVFRINNTRPSTGGNGGGPAHERIFRSARFQLTFSSDGSLKGLMGGYQKPEEFGFDGRFAGKVNATIIGIMCPLQYKALAAYADGYPDPKTGECTQVSTAYDVEAVPAFILHSPAEGISVASTRHQG